MLNHNKSNILLIDDQKDFFDNIETAFGKTFNITWSLSPAHARMMLARDNNIYDLVLLDLDFTGDTKARQIKEGLKYLPEIKQKYPNIPVIVVTNNEDRDTVVEVMQNGADDFIFKKDYNVPKWRKKILKQLKVKQLYNQNKQLTEENLTLRKQLQHQYPFIGESKGILEIKKNLRFLAKDKGNTTILITGETGTGKEVAARYLYSHGIERYKAFQAVHLSAISKNLLESELFGHKKGAFTGALKDKEGRFHRANGGILFLDEIGDIDMNIQAKLMRFLQERTIQIVGTTNDIKLDIQIVVATNKNLQEEVEKGTFRLDLYQRLKQFPIHLPTLRERKEDIDLIIAHYFNINASFVPNFFNSLTYSKLRQYNYPGNIRELKHALDAMQLRKRIQDKAIIDESCLPEEILNYNVNAKSSIKSKNKSILDKTLSSKEKRAWEDLQNIEELFAEYKKKGVVADKLGKTADTLRYMIFTNHEKYPALFDNFPLLKKAYKLQ